MSAYTKLCQFLSTWCMRLGIAGLILLIACVTWQVFGRYVLNNTPTWAETLSLVLVLYVTMFGVAVGVRDAGHIGLESLLVLASEKVRTRMEYIIHALVLVFGAVMFWQCLDLAKSVWAYALPTLPISEGWRYVPACIAGFLIVMFSVEHILNTATGRTNESHAS
jgi:TRAP-type transport system small permease protein